VAECPVGQFATGARCRSCDVIGCLVCPSEGVCARCEQPLWLLNRTCAASCPPGYHGNTATRACDRCDAACRTCADGVSASVCTSCHATRALNDGACVDECPRDRLLSRAACVHQCPQTSLCNVVLNSGTSHHIPCLSVCLSVCHKSVFCETSGQIEIGRVLASRVVLKTAVCVSRLY